MKDNMESSDGKVLKVITAIAALCTIFGISVASILSFYFDKDDDTNTSQTIIDHKFSEEQKVVNYYVPLCKNQIIPLERLEECTDEELYYIRNGIYAYEGMIFKKNYYKVFDWYNGRISPKDFKDGYLNYFQNKNIANIIKVEEKRKLEN